MCTNIWTVFRWRATSWVVWNTYQHEFNNKVLSLQSQLICNIFYRKCSLRCQTCVWEAEHAARWCYMKHSSAQLLISEPRRLNKFNMKIKSLWTRRIVSTLGTTTSTKYRYVRSCALSKIHTQQRPSEPWITIMSLRVPSKSIEILNLPRILDRRTHWINMICTVYQVLARFSTDTWAHFCVRRTEKHASINFHSVVECQYQRTRTAIISLNGCCVSLQSYCHHW